MDNAYRLFLQTLQNPIVRNFSLIRNKLYFHPLFGQTPTTGPVSNCLPIIFCSSYTFVWKMAVCLPEQSQSDLIVEKPWWLKYKTGIVFSYCKITCFFQCLADQLCACHWQLAIFCLPLSTNSIIVLTHHWQWQIQTLNWGEVVLLAWLVFLPSLISSFFNTQN